MDNALQQILGLQSPGIVSDDYSDGGAYYPAPAAADPAPVDQAPAAQPNALQALAAPPPQPTYQAPPPPAAAPAPEPTRPARARSSLIDHIGRIADVLAQVGGASPLYQPTLDSRQDRVLTLGNHDREVTTTGLAQELTRQQIAEGRGKALTSQNALATAAVKRLQAIVAANPNADVGKIWGTLASQAGLSPEQTQGLGQIFTADPSAIEAMASAADKDDEKYSGNVVYATGPDGVLHAFQAGVGSNSSRDILPAGFTAADPLKFANLGGSTAVVGTHSSTGIPTRILPNSEAPGKAADRAERAREADNRNRTTIAVAGMPARGKPGDAKPNSDTSNVLALLDNIQHGFSDLHGMNALPGDNGGAVSNALGALGRTRVGQAVGEQAGMLPAQKRLEIAKNVSALQQAMLKSLPASATRTKFEQEMLARGLPDPTKMSLTTANTVIRQLRESYQRAVNATAGARPTLRPVQPRGNAGGWSVVGVK